MPRELHSTLVLTEGEEEDDTYVWNDGYRPMSKTQPSTQTRLMAFDVATTERRQASMEFQDRNKGCGEECVVIPELVGRSAYFHLHWVEMWDILIIIASLYVSYRLPFELTVIRTPSRAAVISNHVLTLLFTADVCLQFFISYAHDNEDLAIDPWIKDLRVIAARYVAFPFTNRGRGGWFWIDSLSILPGWFRVVRGGHGGPVWYLEFLRVLRLVRMLRNGRTTMFLRRAQSLTGVSYYFLDFVKFLFITSFAIHWFACLWIGMEGKLSQGYFSYHTEGPTWLTALIDTKEDPCEPDVTQDTLCVYIIAVYWATMTFTTVGYGDITPQNKPEYMLCSLFMIFSGYIWAYVVGSVVAQLSNMDPHGDKFKQSMDDLNEVMEDRSVPDDLKIRLRRYMHESRHITRQRAQIRLLEETLSRGLQREVAQCSANNNLLKGIYWADGIDQDARLELVNAFRPMFFGPKESVMVRQTIIVIRRGIMVAKGRVLTRGDTWGHESILLVSPWLVETSVPLTLSYLNAMGLDKRDLTDVAHHFPELDRRLRRAQVRTAVRRAVVMIGQAEKLRRRWNADEQPAILRSFTLRQGEKCAMDSPSIPASPEASMAVFRRTLSNTTIASNQPMFMAARTLRESPKTESSEPANEQVIDHINKALHSMETRIIQKLTSKDFETNPEKSRGPSIVSYKCMQPALFSET